MPRVALFKHVYLPRSEPYVHEQLRALTRWEPLVIARERRNGERFPVDWPGAELRGPLARLVFLLRGRSRRLEREAMRLMPDLIHAHFAVDGVYALRLAEALELPLVVTLHAGDFAAPGRRMRPHPGAWRRALREGRLRERAAACVVLSEAMHAAALARGYAEDRLHLIRLGVDLERWRPPETREPGGPLRILCVSRLAPKKGLSTLLRALKQAEIAGRPCRLTVIGDGPLRARLEREARPFGERVRWLGARDPAGRAEAMAEAQMFCLPIEAEGGVPGDLPQVLVEAAATGLPLVSTLQGGNEELVRAGETGMLVPPRDHEVLGSALQRLAADAGLRRMLGDGARRRVEAEFDRRRQIEKLEDLFDALARIGRAAP